MADVRDQCLRLILKPLLISKKKKNDHHRCTDQVVIKIVFEDADLSQQIGKVIHRSLVNLVQLASFIRVRVQCFQQ